MTFKLKRRPKLYKALLTIPSLCIPWLGAYYLMILWPSLTVAILVLEFIIQVILTVKVLEWVDK